MAIKPWLLSLLVTSFSGCAGGPLHWAPAATTSTPSVAVSRDGQKFTIKTLAAPEAQGYTLVAGSQQDVWYPSDYDSKAGTWTISDYSTAAHHTYDVPPPCSHCQSPANLDVTYGPDGRVWFGGCCEPYFGAMDSKGKTKYYPAKAACNGSPCNIVVGPAVKDNDIWFSALSGYRSTASLTIGYIASSTGKVKAFNVPGSASLDEAGEIVLGPDGNLWFAAGGYIGRATPTGKITLFSAGIDYITELAVGPDHDLWYTAPNTSSVSRMDTSGNILSTFSFKDGYLRQILLGPDKRIWLTETTALLRMTSPTTYQTYPIKQKGEFCQAHGLGLGPDGKLWFSQTGYSTSGTCQYGLGIVANKK